MLGKRRQKTVEVGGEAPDFALPSGGGEVVRLSDFRGERSVVLLFFPFAFTSVCSTELCWFRDSLADLEGLGAKVLAVTADSPWVLDEWAKRERFGFPLLSDFNREVAPLYDSLYEKLGKFVGVPKRSAFVIDRVGVVRYAEICASPGDLPDFDAIRATLGELR
jgi:peroxiredoxin